MLIWVWLICLSPRKDNSCIDLKMEEEKIAEHKKFINERSDKPQEISMELIGQTSLRSESPLSE